MMKDTQLIERLAITDLYRDDVTLPKTMRSDIVFLEIARRMDMDTKERVLVATPPRKTWNRAWIAVAAFAIVIVVGLTAALLSSRGEDLEPATPPTTEAPVTTVEAAAIDIAAADPIQALNDQASRVTITFAGDAQALFEGGAHVVDIQLDLEGSNELNPGVTVNIVSTDGVVASTGTSPPGNEVRATWVWTSNDKLIITMTGRGIGIPDTRPEVVILVQETPSSDAVVFVMDTPAGTVNP
jgi:hypothetical protein